MVKTEFHTSSTQLLNDKRLNYDCVYVTVFFLFLPVTFPSVANIHIVDAMLVGLLVQEVKHVFDS